jgi:glycosyltransferase involved in cell wall biosynthesis
VRIALLHPTYWPEVRRGSERLIHDLAVSLAEGGDEPTIVSSHPGATTRSVEDGVEVIRARRLPEPRRLGFYEDHAANAPNVILRLLRGRFDLAHAFHAADGWAAVQARRLGGPPVVFSFHGIPARPYLVERRGRLAMIKSAAAGAAATTVLSDAAAQAFRRYLLVTPRVLPGGVICAGFAAATERAAEPTIFCAASLGDPRKRAALLFEAFAALRRRRPRARLLVARTRDPVLSSERVELPEGAKWVEVDETPDLARAYASAWVSVLPADDEAFGLVIVESLAAGTPVVSARSGAGPEILGRDELGRLFEPGDAESLARALEGALDSAPSDETAAACRERAADFDWSRVVRSYRRLYESLPAAGQGPRRRS